MRLWGFLRIVLIALAVALLAAFTIRTLRHIAANSALQPLKLAVSKTDTTDIATLRAFSQELQERGQRPGLRLIEVEDSRAAARALSSGASDLAVIRPDVETPNGSSAVMRLRAAPLVLVTRAKGAEVNNLSDLEGKSVGQDPRDSAILDEINAAFAQTQRKPATRKILTAEEIESALTSRKVDVVLFTPSLNKDQAGPALVRKLSTSGSGFRVSAVQPDDVSAIIASLPAVPIKESGLPAALREEDVEEVVCASFVIMARNSVDRTQVATFTERMFYMRAAIAKRSGRPAIFGAVAGDSVTATAMPLHKGAIEYYEREQKTFLERYSDQIWIGIAFSGMVSSVFAWLLRRINRRRAIHHDNVFRDLQAYATHMLHVNDADTLGVHEAEFDALSTRVVELARSGTLDEGDVAAIRLALDHARHAFESARIRVLSAPPRPTSAASPS
ncbi:MAG: hypothetical protein LCH39_00325 [Proteobacteria bacterium]|nr:hypothetical protein [Pseudomonadota bacterium]